MSETHGINDIWAVYNIIEHDLNTAIGCTNYVAVFLIEDT